MYFSFILPLFVSVYGNNYAPDFSVLDTLNISLIPASGLSLSEAFGDIFVDVSNFTNFSIRNNVEVLASGFVWIESPVYVSNNILNGVLFSDVKIKNLGRTYYWDEITNKTNIFIDNSGIIGSLNNDWLIKFRNFSEWQELGAHGNRQIIKFKLKNVDRDNNFVDSCDTKVLVDEYNGISLNSPNDITISKKNNGRYLYFTDPPFGLQRFDDININSFFNQRDLSFSGIYIYDIKNDYLQLFDDTLQGPNGISISDDGRYLLVSNTLNNTSVDPFWRIYDLNCNVDCNHDDGISFIDIKFDNNIWDTLIDFELCDGIDYFNNNLFFATGPSGIYIIDAGTKSILGRITIGDLVSNVDFNYPYLYVTANTNLLRICLRSDGCVFVE